jgi:hypothetical protein
MIINGSSYSRFIISPAGDIPGETIVDLPVTDSQGLVETYITRQIRSELISLDITQPGITKSQQVLGYEIFWTFNYGEWVSGETLMKMQTIIQSAKAGRNLKLIPRTDMDSRYFDVIYSGDDFDLGVRKGGIKAKYNRLPVFRFETKNIEPDLKWNLYVPPDTRTYVYGSDGYEQVTLAA